MPVIIKPRQIRIDIDQNSGFPTRVSIEEIRWVEENGIKISELPVHIETIPADDAKAKKAIGDMASSATSALAVYQNETQRLGVELNQHKDKIKQLTDKIKKYEPDFNGK